MNCREAQAHLSLYLDGEASEERRQELKTHLEVCPACRAELAMLSRLDQALAELAAPPPPDVTQRVLGRVRRPALPWWRSLALAASLVLGLTMGGALAGNFYSYYPAKANGNGGEVLAMEDVFRDFPQGSWGGAIVYQDEEENNA